MLRNSQRLLALVALTVTGCDPCARRTHVSAGPAAQDESAYTSEARTPTAMMPPGESLTLDGGGASLPTVASNTAGKPVYSDPHAIDGQLYYVRQTSDEYADTQPHTVRYVLMSLVVLDDGSAWELEWPFDGGNAPGLPIAEQTDSGTAYVVRGAQGLAVRYWPNQRVQYCVGDMPVFTLARGDEGVRIVSRTRHAPAASRDYTRLLMTPRSTELVGVAFRGWIVAEEDVPADAVVR